MTPNDIDKVVVTHKTKIQEGIEKIIMSSKTGIIKPRQQKKKWPPHCHQTTSLQSRDKRKVNNMEELPIIGKGVAKKKPNQKKLRKIKKMIIHEYEDMVSPAFLKSLSVVKRVLLKKHPSLFLNVLDNFVKDTLEEQSSTYS